MSKPPMPIRWRWILPFIGLVFFGWETYGSVRTNSDLADRNRMRKEYLWGTFRLRTDPRGKIPPTPCPQSVPNCSEWWAARDVIVDPGPVLEALLVSALPAFFVSARFVHGLARIGVNEVCSFFAITPLLIAAWFYFLGWLLDHWRYRRRKKRAAAN